MRTKSFGLLGCVSTILLMFGLTLWANEQKEKEKGKEEKKAEKEEKTTLDKMPKAVIDAVKAKFPKAEMSGGSKEEEDGKTLYEVSIKNQGQSIDVTVTPEGKIVEIEKEIAANTLNKDVKKTLDTDYPKATITKAEEITKDDTLAYEVLLVTADKKTVEVKLDPKGKVLEVENKDSADDDDKGEKKDEKKAKVKDK